MARYANGCECPDCKELREISSQYDAKLDAQKSIKDARKSLTEWPVWMRTGMKP